MGYDFGTMETDEGQDQNCGDLTDDDLDRISGKRDQLIGKSQGRYGLSKDEAERRVADWADKVER
ncbi:MAG: CsbD family protein [Candidatus Binatia bacterium]